MRAAGARETPSKDVIDRRRSKSNMSLNNSFGALHGLCLVLSRINNLVGRGIVVSGAPGAQGQFGIFASNAFMIAFAAQANTGCDSGVTAFRKTGHWVFRCTSSIAPILTPARGSNQGGRGSG